MLKPPFGVLVPLAPARRFQVPPPVAELTTWMAAAVPLAVPSEPVTVRAAPGAPPPMLTWPPTCVKTAELRYVVGALTALVELDETKASELMPRCLIRT